MKNYRLIIALICLLGASFAQAKVYHLKETGDSAAALKSAEKVLKQFGLLDIMTSMKAPSNAWIASNTGMKEIILDSNLDPKKMTGSLRVIAIANNGEKSVMGASDPAKIAKLKAAELEKTLKGAGLL